MRARKALLARNNGIAEYSAAQRTKASSTSVASSCENTRVAADRRVSAAVGVIKKAVIIRT